MAKNKKNKALKIVAIVTAALGVLVAVAAFIKRKAARLSEDLDFDGDLYFEDDEYNSDEDAEEFGGSSDELNSDSSAAENVEDNSDKETDN